MDGQQAPIQIPKIVKIISILYCILGVLLLIFALLMFLSGITFGSSTLKLIFTIVILLGFGTSITTIPLFVSALVGLAVLLFFVGISLWKCKKWSRIAAIVISVLGLLQTVVTIIQEVLARDILSLVIISISLLMNLAIGGYLMFSNNAKSAFYRY